MTDWIISRNTEVAMLSEISKVPIREIMDMTMDNFFVFQKSQREKQKKLYEKNEKQ